MPLIAARCNTSSFQFQKGTINPNFPELNVEWLKTFQFQKGTINPSRRLRPTACCRNFNSKKVRLIPFTVNPASTPIPFQFQKGTINPRTDIQIRGA